MRGARCGIGTQVAFAEVAGVSPSCPVLATGWQWCGSAGAVCSRASHVRRSWRVIVRSARQSPAADIWIGISALRAHRRPSPVFAGDRQWRRASASVTNRNAVGVADVRQPQSIRHRARGGRPRSRPFMPNRFALAPACCPVSCFAPPSRRGARSRSRVAAARTSSARRRVDEVRWVGTSPAVAELLGGVPGRAASLRRWSVLCVSTWTASRPTSTTSRCARGRGQVAPST